RSSWNRPRLGRGADAPGRAERVGCRPSLGPGHERDKARHGKSRVSRQLRPITCAPPVPGVASGVNLVWRCRLDAGWPRAIVRGEASVTAKTIPSHARTFERQRPGPGPAEGSVPGAQNHGSDLRPAQQRARADPLADPVVITERAVLGDRLRRPTAWCEMPACI